MYRNQYDSDITTFSPSGRIHQIEYAMEAVKQGSAAVALKSKKYAVLVSLKRSSSELGSYQKKLFVVDDHIGIAISGLTADARVLCNYMRNECSNYKYIYESDMRVERLITKVADKSQVHTQRYGRRPYGVGLLVAGYDQTGAHVYQTCPSGNYYSYKAISIGARSQSAKTYLEKYFDSFEQCDLKELIVHGLRALRETIPNTDTGLTTKNVSIAIVGEDQKFKIIEGDDTQDYLNLIESGEEAAQPMQQD
ncbi:20S proteasome subunit C2 [Cavenderia fasciculata]|uniref:Proteasome subunit alpha type n=1 Tax=Cavenderia fasciculata TaxID=261658 RepID=F4PYC7_CACFS|nr:20S proteasome subunit C2 [Cavenderia fasciculata]EGG19394.1 20S proteasome subunit C2 [Cavenderia fasciculata]|eukprot:XP_004357665.1 20S proteasome subunit C2 [Cavenderia fasciculata]